LNEAPFLGLAFELPGVVVRILRCDVEAQMFCSEHHYSVFTASFIAVIALSIISMVFSVTGIPVVSTLLSLVGFTALVFFVAFGYSPSCAPLIPSCLFQSMAEDINYWLPVNIIIPQSLLRCRHDQTMSVPPASCIIKCEEEPFYFTDWTANFAWVLCEFSQSSCQGVQTYLSDTGNTISTIIGADASTVLVNALYRSQVILASGDLNVITGYKWCNAINSWQLLPLATVTLFAITTIPFLITVGVRAFIGLVRTSFAAYALSHV
jgi:hypothetical protein